MKYIVLILLVFGAASCVCGLPDYKLYDQRCTSGCVALWKDKCVAGEYDHRESKGKRHVIKCNCYMKNGKVNGIHIERQGK